MLYEFAIELIKAKQAERIAKSPAITENLEIRNWTVSMVYVISTEVFKLVLKQFKFLYDAVLWHTKKQKSFGVSQKWSTYLRYIY